MMNPRVEKVEANDNFTLTVYFTNGQVGSYDVSPLLNKGIFSNLKDLSVFKQARVSLGTVEWPGQIDICPDTLYEDSKKI